MRQKFFCRVLFFFAACLLTASTASAQEAMSLAAARVASHAFINQGADLAAWDGLSAALHSRGAFFALGGGKNSYSTATRSYVDLEGLSLITGVAWKRSRQSGELLLAPFVEAGWGSYDSFDCFTSYGVNANGDTSYFGGGLMVRYDLRGGTYFEASGRAGSAKLDYSSRELRNDYRNGRAEYDVTSAYYGAHAGVGRVWSINEKASFDFYVKYFWSRQEGKTVYVANDPTGGPTQFMDMNSHRLRFGGRLTFAVNERFSPYVGAAYEYEFDGRSKAHAFGQNFDAAEITGGSGIGELGFSVKPSQNSPISIDFGLQGYTGQREGVSGKLRFTYEF